ncbi:MAG: hypothetical protein NVS4B12_04930 [Ktedonobacteraceae bacterium]
MPVLSSQMLLFGAIPLYSIIDTVGEFKFHARIDVNNRLKLSIRNEFADGINYRNGIC